MRGQTLLNMLDDGIDIAESDPFSAASSSCQPIRCSAKKVDQRRCRVGLGSCGERVIEIEAKLRLVAPLM